MFDISVAVIAGVNIVGVVISGIVAHTFTKRRENSARQFLCKHECYEGVMQILADILKPIMLGRESDDKQKKGVLKRFLDVKVKLLIWSGKDVLNAVHAAFPVGVRNLNEENIECRFENLIRAMRKELGHNDKRIAEGCIIRLLIKNDGRKKNIGGQPDS